jgi:hypothetical protein
LIMSYGRQTVSVTKNRRQLYACLCEEIAAHGTWLKKSKKNCDLSSVKWFGE